MKFLRKFNEHTYYEAEVNRVGVDISLPNVSYCEDVKDVHYLPYNFVRFYVGEITGTTPQTVKIYTDSSTSVDIQVSESNKWYTYALPKDKGLYQIEGDSVKKVVVKSDFSYKGNSTYPMTDRHIIPQSTVEASFKGSNTSKVENMGSMFAFCSGLTYLDISNFDTSNVTKMGFMFYNCEGLTSLVLSGLNVSNVVDMQGIFQSCSRLETLNLSGWDTSKVTDMGGMFSDCSGLTSLDLSGFDTRNVTNMRSMFDGCSNSLNIRMIGCSTETVGKIQNQLTADGITGATITTK